MKTIYKVGYWLIWTLRLYLTWSKIFRFFYHRKYRFCRLDDCLQPEAAQKRMGLLTWTKDGPRALWDAIGSPHWVQYCINQRMAGKPQPEGYLDCDEFAVWAASVVGVGYQALVLNVYYDRGDGAGKGGHNVCVVKDGQHYYHIGNWGKSRAYMSMAGVIHDVWTRAADSDGYLVGWALFEPKTLRFVRCGTLSSY